MQGAFYLCPCESRGLGRNILPCRARLLHTPEHEIRTPAAVCAAAQPPSSSPRRRGSSPAVRLSQVSRRGAEEAERAEVIAPSRLREGVRGWALIPPRHGEGDRRAAVVEGYLDSRQVAKTPRCCVRKKAEASFLCPCESRGLGRNILPCRARLPHTPEHEIRTPAAVCAAAQPPSSSPRRRGPNIHNPHPLPPPLKGRGTVSLRLRASA